MCIIHVETPGGHQRWTRPVELPAITEVTLSATYYDVLATMVKAFGVELEGEAVVKMEQAWQSFCIHILVDHPADCKYSEPTITWSEDCARG